MRQLAKQQLEMRVLWQQAKQLLERQALCLRAKPLLVWRPQKPAYLHCLCLGHPQLMLVL